MACKASTQGSCSHTNVVNSVPQLTIFVRARKFVNYVGRLQERRLVWVIFHEKVVTLFVLV